MISPSHDDTVSPSLASDEVKEMESDDPIDIVDHQSHHVHFVSDSLTTETEPIELSVTLRIKEVGCHPTEDMVTKLWSGNVAMVILVVDSSMSSTVHDAIDLVKRAPFMQKGGVHHHDADGSIPLLVAANKCDLKRGRNGSNGMSDGEIRRVVDLKLQSILEEAMSPKNREDVPTKRKQHRFTNMTVLNAPNLKLLQAPTRSMDDDEEADCEMDSDTENAPRTRIKRSDSRRIKVIPCSAKKGSNISKVFEHCLRRIVPLTLKQSVARKLRRGGTTAHINAPIWLRQVVDEFDDGNDESAKEMQSVFGNPLNRVTSAVDDNFTILGD